MAEKFWKPLRILWAAMLLAVVMAVAVLAQGQWSSDGELRREVFKSALQVLVVAVVGNLLTLGVQTVLKEQDRLAAERVKQQELAATATCCCRSCKTAEIWTDVDEGASV